jgi:hypothetical protein
VDNTTKGIVGAIAAAVVAGGVYMFQGREQTVTIPKPFATSEQAASLPAGVSYDNSPVEEVSAPSGIKGLAPVEIGKTDLSTVAAPVNIGLSARLKDAAANVSARPAAFGELAAPVDATPLKMPFRGHGFYWFTTPATDDSIGRCQAAYGRLKDSYPVPAVMLNRTLLADTDGADRLMGIFGGDTQIVVWVDVTTNPDDLTLLAGFITRHGDRIGLVCLGGPSLEGASRQMLPADAQAGDLASWKLWASFIRYALPQTPVIQTWQAANRFGDGYNQAVHDSLGPLVSGVCLWNMPSVWYWSEGREKDADRFRPGTVVAGGWIVNTPLVLTRGGSAQDRAFAAQEVSPLIAPTERIIAEHTDGLIRFVGNIPADYLVIEDLKP